MNKQLTSPQQKVIELHNVTRDYNTTIGIINKSKKTIKAVKPISFHVNKGEIFGLLGPNGAGKTTLIKMMTTLLIPTSGTMNILGYNVYKEEKKIRPHINFVFGGERNLYWRLSAEDNLKFFADIYLVPRKIQSDLITTVLKKVDLYDERLRKVETFSKGMKQRLQIAKSLLNTPDILFLDEPTIGLDPIGAKALRGIVKEIATNGTAVILTTHYMPEAEELCDRIAIINEGSLIALDTINGLKQINNSLHHSLEDIYMHLLGGTKHD